MIDPFYPDFDSSIRKEIPDPRHDGTHDSEAEPDQETDSDLFYRSHTCAMRLFRLFQNVKLPFRSTY